MTTAPADSNAQSPKLNTLIKRTWGKLTDEEIGFHDSNTDKFFDALKTKYSINKDEVEKTMKKLDTECADAHSPAKSAETGSAPLPKAAHS